MYTILAYLYVFDLRAGAHAGDVHGPAARLRVHASLPLTKRPLARRRHRLDQPLPLLL